MPIADFSLVEVPQLLYEELPISLSGIGAGIAFGSEKAHEASWFEGMQTHHIPKDLRQKILIFDLWVKNMDRTPSNPNLLYRAKSAELIVIDHNLAFDKDFTLSDFLQTHIFSDCFTEIASDLVTRSELEAWLQTAFASLEEICDNLPLEWEWLNMECDLPTNYDFEFMLRCLERCTIPGKLWEDA